MAFGLAHASNACALVTGYPGTPEALTVTSSSLPESLCVFTPDTSMTCLPSTFSEHVLGRSRLLHHVRAGRNKHQHAEHSHDRSGEISPRANIEPPSDLTPTSSDTWQKALRRPVTCAFGVNSLCFLHIGHASHTMEGNELNNRVEQRQETVWMRMRSASGLSIASDRFRARWHGTSFPTCRKPYATS